MQLLTPIPTEVTELYTHGSRSLFSVRLHALYPRPSACLLTGLRASFPCTCLTAECRDADSAVFFATLYRTIQLYRRTVFEEALSLITVIMRDGKWFISEGLRVALSRIPQTDHTITFAGDGAFVICSILATHLPYVSSALMFGGSGLTYTPQVSCILPPSLFLIY